MADKIQLDETAEAEDMEGVEDSSEDESDSDSSDLDEELENKLETLEEKLQSNPFMYDLHAEKIKLLREKGELLKLRDAREAMNKIFPLTEEMWLAWIQDEMKIAVNPEDRENITALFDRAVAEYMSVGVWLEYVQHTIGCMAEVDGIQKIRGVFERAITAVGLHVSKGSMIWEAYREFENAILMGLQPSPGTVVAKEQQAQIDAQTNRVNNLFRRQLAVPLQDMRSTMLEYKEWMTDDSEDTHLQQVYNKALDKLDKLQPLEDSLLESTPPAVSAYEKYIAHEVSGGEPARIQCVYERAIQDHCLNSQLWNKYVKYLVTKLKVRDVTVRVCERSVQNCPWDAELWTTYARVLERHNDDHVKVKGIFERALNAGFNQAQAYLRVWEGQIDFLRRKIDWGKDHEDELEQLRTTLDSSVTFMEQSFGAEGDPDCRLQKYYARLEAKHCHNMSKCRELWAKILQKGFGNQYSAWMEYFNLESSHGDKKHCMKLLQHAMNSVTDFPEAIFDTYISYTAEEGSLDEYDQAVIKCEAQLQRVKERLEKAAEKESQASNEHNHQRDDRKGSKKAGKKLPKNQPKRHPKQNNKSDLSQHSRDSSHSPNQQHLVDGSTWNSSRDGPPPLQALQDMADGSIPVGRHKRKHEDSVPVQTDSDGFKVPAPPGFKSKTARLEGPSQPPPGFKPKDSSTAAPPGYKPKAQTSAQPEVQSKAASDQQLLEQCMQEVADDPDEEIMDMSAPEPSRDTSHDNCTVFVSNLAYNVDESKLQHIFKKVGEIKEIRLIRNVKGKSRGFAYVQFLDEFPVQTALLMDRDEIDGRPMFVSPCEQKGAKTNKFKFSTSVEKNKLFVKGLPFTATKDALETIFSQHGALKSVRIVTYRSGASKGLAYIEFEDETAAAQAVIKTDGLQIGDHSISVAISNPPERKPAQNQRDPAVFTPTLGSGKRDTTERGKARTQLPMIPRALKKAPASGTAKPARPSADNSTDSSTNGDGQSSTPSSKMSNADFRNMLLSK